MIHVGIAVEAISDGDWFAVCLIAYFVCLTCGYLIVRNS